MTHFELQVLEVGCVPHVPFAAGAWHVQGIFPCIAKLLACLNPMAQIFAARHRAGLEPALPGVELQNAPQTPVQTRQFNRESDALMKEFLLGKFGTCMYCQR